MEFGALERRLGANPLTMSARALCNEIEGTILAVHGAEKLNELLHPPTREEMAHERALAVLALGGEVV